jgi:glucose/arabinose dehydrogenase
VRKLAGRAPGLALALAAAVAGVLALAAPASAEPALPEGFQDEVVLSNLDQPTDFRFAKDGRIFVALKSGEILVFDDLDDPTPEVFADLRTDVYDNGDRGLLGLALDPKFTEGRPYVYALYTYDHVLGDPAPAPKYGAADTSGDPDCPTQNTSHTCLVSGRLVRLEENLLNKDHAVESGGHPVQTELLQGWCQQFSSHSVGELQFGPEGALYVSGGDGAAYESIPDYGQLGTPPNPCGDSLGAEGPGGTFPHSKGGALRAQNLELLNGAILRVDPDTGLAWPDNPLASDPDLNAQRTVAKGFRNPFRFTFDPQTGDIYTGNVGSSQIEEIDTFPAPPTTLFNSGWPCYEGIQHQFQFRMLNLDICNALYAGEPTSTSLPFFSYSHEQSVVPDDECPTDSGSAVTGVSFYEGDEFPAAYKGAFFFADSVRGCIWVMFPGANGKPDPSSTMRFLRDGKIYPGVKIAEGPDGHLYYADLFSNEGLGDGAIHRIVYAPGAPTARLTANPPYGKTLPLAVTFDASKSTDPSSESLTYEWDLDGNGSFETVGGVQRIKTFTKAELDEAKANQESGNRVVAVRVKDGTGLTSVARITVYPGDKPPVPTITAPGPSFKWVVGSEINLDAEAVDADGAEITTPLPYYWITRLAHCPNPTNPTACHVHPLQTFSGIRRPTFIAPQHDYPSYIEVILRVSDERGLSGTTSLKIDPRTANVSVASDPPGIELTTGSTEAAAPFSTPAIEGSEILLSAPPTAELNGRTYVWQGWSDGGSRSHSILIAGDASYQAVYSMLAMPGGGETEAPIQQSPRPDTTAPQTALLFHPAKKTRKKTAKFAFSSNESGSFRCKLDHGAFKSCVSPRSYKALKLGEHVFRVVATDASGNVDPSPASFTWKVTSQLRR